MKVPICVSLVATVGGLIAGGPGGDRPDATHVWAVHDENRPLAEPVSAEEGVPPSDSITLFDGTQKSVDLYWRGRSRGAECREPPTRWYETNGVFLCALDSGPAHVTNRCANFQLHLEMMIPADASPGEGNSGVYVAGAYELQVLNSYGSLQRPDPHPPWSDSYADGEMGAIYGQRPPLVNPSRRAGKWQSYDIVFHAARWKGGELLAPATISAFLNGVLIHDGVRLEGPTWYCQRTKHDLKHESPLPIVVMLQDHGNPVLYRNIWYRQIPVQDSKCERAGEFDAKESVRLRTELAEQTLKHAHSAENPDSKLVWLWESYAYRADPRVKKEIDSYTPQYIRRLETICDNPSVAIQKEVSNMREFSEMGIRCGLFSEDCALVRAIKAAVARIQRGK